MPSDLRFEDLDLREEPAGELDAARIFTDLCSAFTTYCSQTVKCSVGCC